MENNLEGVFLRLGYALREAKNVKNTTIILGAGCSLSSTKRDISTYGIMKQCLTEHGINNMDNIGWEELYKKFINIVWQGKAPKERQQLLRSKLDGLKPTEAHLCLRSLVEHGYIHNIITTNFDMLLEETFKGLSYQKRVDDGDYSTIGIAPSFNLLKVHGDLDEGKFRFAPHELVQLPSLLQKDIEEKTAGPLIFVGYRGQDIGLMNALSTKNEYAVYWIDITPFDYLDMYTTQNIQNFMINRSSSGNYLYGKEFGDFNTVIKKLNDFLINPSHNVIISAKEFQLNDIWKESSIVEMLRIYSRIYEMFLDILEISSNVQQQFERNLENSKCIINYNEYLYSYLYFFNSKNLPSNLLHIPNNELDAFMLGVSAEILVRTTGTNISPRDYISKLKLAFENKYDQSVLNDSFWHAVEKIVCSNCNADNVVNLNMPNKLVLKTYDVPLKELNELLRLVSFLALLLPTNADNNRRIDNKYKIRQFLNGKYNQMIFDQDIIIINLGIINSDDAESLYNLYLKSLPGIHILRDTNLTNGRNYICFKSKWIQINLEIVEKENIELNNDVYFFKILEKQSERSQANYLRLKNVDGQTVSKHVNLQFDKDIPNFLNSDKIGMFVIGASGCGKTSALQNFICNKNNNIIPIIISPKNHDITKRGLSLFLDLDITNKNQNMVLKYMNNFMLMHQKVLLLIFDGLNEVDENIKAQQILYRELLELADEIYQNQYLNIKMIITCRKQAYYEYKHATALPLNPLYFYTNDAFIPNREAIYTIPKLTVEDKSLLLTEYISSDYLNEIASFQDAIFSSTDNITPFFIAIVAESINTHKDTEIIEKCDTIYELFSNTMLQRLELADSFLAYKIIYTYFDLLIKHKKDNIQITNYKLLNALDGKYHNSFNNIINKLIDVNILIKDCLKLGKLKFQHDKIEEFFFKQYIEESEYKGLSFFHSVFDLCERNVIYQNGVLQYFLDLEKSKRLKELKDLINNMFVEHIDMLSKILVQLLSCSRDLNDTLFYLVNPADTEESRKIISAIMWGVDQNFQDFSSSTYSIKRIIDALQTEPINQVIPKDMQIYIYFFKSKLEYFLGDYINALNYVKKAQKVSKCHDSILSTKIDIHYAVILMEQGHSKKCINCLEEDYKVHQDSNNIKIKIDVGIELGRALNHSGQIARTLKLYDDLLIHENQIADSYVLARIYEQKANVLNKLMFYKLQYGFVKKETLSPNTIIEIKKLFKEALLLYNKAIKLLLETNAIFTYSGVLPEKINTYISYSISIEPQGIDECKNMITELDSIFNIISTPFETDFDLSKAYYYEYMKNTDIAESYIKKALKKALKMQIKNKEAKCRCFYSQFCYRQLKRNTNNAKKWLTIGTEQLEMAIKYYQKYTLIDHNISLENCYLLRENFSQINA